MKNDSENAVYPHHTDKEALWQARIAANDNNNPAKEEQKRRGQYPLHDEEIGGG